ncbi:pectinesterase family protein [Caulobacter sp. DWR1-3-2b1]|uniref:pectinesterase family protein n=1 Tax=Caulobacter sp. DWR1-3-2b1 TaxID=2804670 RepID=UPI003CF9E092
MKRLWIGMAFATAFLESPAFAETHLKVAPSGAPFTSVQAAVDALPAQGGVIEIAPGVYREKLTVSRTHVRFKGLGKKPDDVVLVWGDASATVGGTFKSASVTITGDDFQARNLTIANDYHQKAAVPSQAVALFVNGDRAVFDRLRLLGAQDTLYAGHRKCAPGAACQNSRQYFRNTYIEGHIDFIFGDGKTVFERCHLHAIGHDGVFFTAQSRLTPEQDSGYIFDRAKVTVDPKATGVFLGRAWRPYATVVFLNAKLGRGLESKGWREWTPGKTETWKTAYFAEYRSRGAGANLNAREPWTHQLTKAQTAKWSMPAYLRGADGWTPKAEM